MADGNFFDMFSNEFNMFKSSTRELFPLARKIAVSIRLGNGSLVPFKVVMEVAAPISVFAILLLYCLQKASVDSYVSFLM